MHAVCAEDLLLFIISPGNEQSLGDRAHFPPNLGAFILKISTPTRASNEVSGLLKTKKLIMKNKTMSQNREITNEWILARRIGGAL